MIAPATWVDILSVALQMRDRDFEEMSATSHAKNRVELAEELADRYGTRHDLLCVSKDGAPVCIGGAVPAWPGVVSLMMFATPQFPEVGLETTRFIRGRYFPALEANGIHRIQAISLAGYTEVHDWLRTLGMEQEAVIPAFGKNGETFVQFGRVRGARSARAA